MKPIALKCAGLLLLGTAGASAIAGTSYQLESITHTDLSGTYILKDQVVRVVTTQNGSSTRTSIYPHQANATSPNDPAWTQIWSTEAFIEHESDPDVLCAAAIRQSWKLSQQPAKYITSGYVFECTWDGGKTWRTVDQVAATLGQYAPEPDLPYDWSASVAVFGHLNRLTYADDGSKDLLLTKYNKVYRIKVVDAGQTTNATLTHTIPLPAECPTPSAGGALCANLLLDNYPPVWWDPGKAGQGVTLTPVAGNVWGYHTTYGADGQADWVLINFTPDSQSGSLSTWPASLFTFNGPTPSSSWDTASITQLETFFQNNVFALHPFTFKAYGPRLLRVTRGAWPDAAYGSAASTAKTGLNMVPFE